MDQYKLFLDKLNNFECKLELQGASLENAKARLVLEGGKRSYLYTGKITESGECKINIEKLNEIFKSGETGTLRLEVIAEDAYFAPWESDFVVDSSKKLRVEVMTQPVTESKPTIVVKNVSQTSAKQKEFGEVVSNVIDELKKNGVTKHNAKQKKNTITRTLTENLLVCDFKHNPKEVLTNIMKGL